MKQNTSIIPQILKDNPRIAVEIAESFLDMTQSKLIDYNFLNGKSNELPLITFKITPRCNLNCVMCGQNGVNGTLKGADIKCEEETMVSIEKYKELTDEVAGKTKVFYVWGGEPLLYPNFMDLAQYMAKKVAFTINTNGTLLAQNAKRIVEDKWTAIFISLDSFEEVNDQIRGKGTYARVMEGMDAINREKKAQNSTLPYVGIVTTISNKNYMYLDKLALAMKDKGLSWHIINLGTYTTPEIGEEQEKYMKETFGIEAKYWKGFTSGYNKGIDGQKFAEILAKTHEVDNGYPIITVPVIKPERIGIYHGELNTLVQDHCAAPWFSVNINYNGDVHFCADYPDYVIGNIKNEKLLDMYNNEKAVKFRHALKERPDGLFPACKRCYQLMLCGHKREGF